jgi:hypothetical protein
LQWKTVPYSCGEKTRYATFSGKTRFCVGKKLRVVGKNSSQLTVEKCQIHAVKKRDTQLVVEEVDFAMETQRMYWEKIARNLQWKAVPDACKWKGETCNL